MIAKIFHVFILGYVKLFFVSLLLLGRTLAAYAPRTILNLLLLYVDVSYSGIAALFTFPEKYRPFYEGFRAPALIIYNI